MKFILDYSGERWVMLVLGYATYLALERFWTTLMICTLSELFICFLMSPVQVEWRQKFFDDEMPTIRKGVDDDNKIDYDKSVWIDLLLRIGVIWSGLTINAFSGYAFDLTFYRGYTEILVFIVFFVYGWFRLAIFAMMMTDNLGQTVLLDPKYPWTPVSMNPKKSDYLIMMEQAKWHILMFVILVASACCTETIVFSEPWTFSTFFSYFVSVWFLIIISDASRMNGQGYWWTFLGFIVFWGILILGSVLFVDIERKHNVSIYFSL